LPWSNRPATASGARRDVAPREILNLLASRGGVLGAEMACHDGDLDTIAAMLHGNPALPLHDHLGPDQEELIDLVLRFQPDVLAKMRFAGASSTQRARWLLERGVDPRRPNWLGITPLHRFALQGRRDMAELCLEFDAELNVLDDEYSSNPLGWAARAGQRDMVRWLLELGARADLPPDKPWALPRAWAQRQGHHNILPLLQG
jgi:ankyrin repeat protein